MKVLSILSAFIVTVFLYLLVFERAALLNFSSTGNFLKLIADIKVPNFTSAKEATRGDNKAEKVQFWTAQSSVQTRASELAPKVSSDGSQVREPKLSSSEPVIKVVATQSRASLVNNAVVLRGRTQAARQVDVMAETFGKVISEPLRKGHMVNQDQILCKIDPGTRIVNLTDARSRLAEARARLPEAKARQEEAQARLDEAVINNNAAIELSVGGFATETRLATTQAAVRGGEAAVQAANSGIESALAGIQSAKAAVATAEHEIDRLTITAPFDGLLETDTAEFGSLMHASGPKGAHCATIIQLDPLKLVGYVPETEVNKVVTGALATAQLAAGGDTVTGQVSFISRSADPKTRTFRVEIEVPNPDMLLRDGQTADILITAPSVKAHLIPQSALTLNDDGKLGVRIVDNMSRAQFREVELLRDTPQGMLLMGLSDNAMIILVGQEYVIDDVRVEFTLAETVQ